MYIAQLRVSFNLINTETYNDDYLLKFEWKNLEVIKEQLELLFHITKALEGNTDFKDGNYKASYGQLRELLPIFELILSHFEDLEKQVKVNDFDGHPGIARLITFAWNKAKDYYGKIDESIAWIASIIMNPMFKMKYFEDKWTGNESFFLRTVKLKVKKLWDDVYKRETVIIWPQSPPSIDPLVDYLAGLLNRVAPQQVILTRALSRKDQYAQYLEELVSQMPIMQY